MAVAFNPSTQDTDTEDPWGKLGSGLTELVSRGFSERLCLNKRSGGKFRKIPSINLGTRHTHVLAYPHIYACKHMYATLIYTQMEKEILTQVIV